MHSLLQSVGLSNKPNPDLVGFFKQQCFLCSHLCTVIMDISFPLHLPQLGLLEALYPLQPGTLLACLWVDNTEQPGKGTSTSIFALCLVFLYSLSSMVASPYKVTPLPKSWEWEEMQLPCCLSWSKSLQCHFHHSLRRYRFQERDQARSAWWESACISHLVYEEFVSWD